MTRTVNALEDGGYVVRRGHETDGRVVVVSLTDVGRERVLADRRRRDEWLARQLRDLTPDERELLRAAAPIIQRLSEQD
jgi:DNA-binding MarR family transcriptional regulator